MKFTRDGAEHDAVEAVRVEIVLGTDGTRAAVGLAMTGKDGTIVFHPMTLDEARDLATRIRYSIDVAEGRKQS